MCPLGENQRSDIIKFVVSNLTFIKGTIFRIMSSSSTGEDKVCHFNPLIANILKNFGVALKTVGMINDHGVSVVDLISLRGRGGVCGDPL
jgi:hypothetical protein